jgi:hypothetical protein
MNNIFPLVENTECHDLFTGEGSFIGIYSMKPIFEWLPNFNGLDEEEKKEYKYKNIKEGNYLVGLEVISDRWVNKGFCGMLLECYGLVLDEAYPMSKIGDSKFDENPMIYLKFDHITFSTSVGV